MRNIRILMLLSSATLVQPEKAFAEESPTVAKFIGTQGDEMSSGPKLGTEPPPAPLPEPINQEPGSSNEADSGANEGTQRIIVVTAQRRNQNTIDVPISVSALDDRMIEAAGLTSFRDLPAIAPGTNIAAVGGYIQPTIRGITTTVIGIGQESNVATYVDGFYQPNPLALNRNIQNIESIQILKGPQGTLFGRNATGGAILIKTRDPSFAPSGTIGVSYGRYNELIADAYFTHGIGDRWPAAGLMDTEISSFRLPQLHVRSR
ncbi:TonB-dependent receptor plug domain-containing protein [Rhizorhapis sp. SPR117]|uniref:TonB-dependent receptor plug domain-containing protein n=1 Tax=Rhizorhapis sp. SPR117 TaxID=2912611 RepID=UPI001F259A5E|nr:TonB-dependent receptor plug domain-containing protein [Rhizorhapis sp. SPR117]